MAVIFASLTAVSISTLVFESVDVVYVILTIGEAVMAIGWFVLWRVTSRAKTPEQ